MYKTIQPNVVSDDKLLIVNTDDLSMNNGKSDAIIDAYQNDIVTSTSSFVSFAESVHMLI